MKLEDQVCSLPLAQRLKELGVKQESFFYHRVPRRDDPNDRLIIDFKINSSHYVPVSAFTVAELGEMLPDSIDHPDNDAVTFFNAHKTGYFGDRGWQLRYGGVDDPKIVNMLDTSEADARAKMLIYLLENNLIELT